MAKRSEIKGMETIGLRIKRLREQKGWTMNELAKMANLQQSLISYYERDERLPSFLSAIELARALGVSLDYLSSQGNSSLPLTKYEQEFKLLPKNQQMDIEDQIKDLIRTNMKKIANRQTEEKMDRLLS